jgi:hypothetical protein
MKSRAQTITWTPRSGASRGQGAFTAVQNRRDRLRRRQPRVEVRSDLRWLIVPGARCRCLAVLLLLIHSLSLRWMDNIIKTREQQYTLL